MAASAVECQSVTVEQDLDTVEVGSSSPEAIVPVRNPSPHLTCRARSYKYLAVPREVVSR